MRLFETEGLTAAPVYDIADILEDPHFKARRTFVDVPDRELGTVTMNAPTPRLSETPGVIRWPGPALGAHNREVYAGELGLSDQEIARLQADGII
jgi:crotonobetainyl-CoA:carnitine CoA-transferase CaiB-like acyl-CoA transferase